jgi:hypothetical protein
MEKRIFEAIIRKKEYSKLPKKDVEKVFKQFEKREVSDIEKIRLTRELLRKTYTAFFGSRLLSSKASEKDESWILKKHISTKERFNYYGKLYEKLLKKYRKVTVIDLGSGVNGFSYKFFPCKVEYLGIEAVSQLVDLTNIYFKKNKIKAKSINLSLFELSKVKEVIKKTKKPRVVFLFKTIGSLENVERNYSKKLLSEIVPLADKVVVSLATKSFFKRGTFRKRRKWLIGFIEKNFKVLEDFEISGERYLILKQS